MAQDEKVILGKVGAPYGIKGWLKLTPYTDDPAGVFDYESLFIQMNGQWQQHSVSNWRRHNNGIVFKFDAVDDRDSAQVFVNAEIGVSEQDLPDLDEDEFYWRDLIGMSVSNESGYTMGQVTDLLETGSNDVLVVKAKPNDAFGKQERLIPFLTDTVIKEIDQQAKTIVVDWDPGF